MLEVCIHFLVAFIVKLLFVNIRPTAMNNANKKVIKERQGLIKMFNIVHATALH